MNGKNSVIHWFRKGLRVHDNPALLKAFDIVRNDVSNFVLRPIFILDPGIVDWMNVGANRWRFLQQSLEQLNENLIKLGTRLYVVRGSPKDVFPRIFTDWNVNFLTFERDIEPYALKRDALLAIQAKEYNVKIIEEISHNVFNPELILQKNDGKPIMQYQKFISIVEKCKEPVPVDVPIALPTIIVPKDSFEIIDEKCYDHPTLDQLVKKPGELGPNKYPGGETEGLSRMEQYLKRKQWVADFEKPNTAPNSIEPSTTVLSPYLKFGCLSSRVFYKKLKAVLLLCKKYSKPPVSLMGQLMWREFYYCAGAAESNFDKMEGNNICYQIPWQRNDDHLKAWTNGTTGYPFIDAIMRQLRQEGWIHHLARHAVACFLTRGDLWISWEEGQKVFEELLLDADWALNAGNWMWLSASAFFYQYFRVYSPVAFGKKTDPDGKYIRKYIPELKLYPSTIIYEPWKASEKSQKEYRCVIGKDYPKRIVIHETIHKENLSKMAQAYKNNREERENINKSISNLSNKSTFVVSSNKRKRSSPTAHNPSKVKRQ